MHFSSSSVVVIGSIFLDYKRFRGGVVKDVRNHVTKVSHGGVARNIAENLGWLGLNVELITLSSSDRSGQLISERLKRARVKLTARNVAGGIGRFTATLDLNGMLLASAVALPPFELLNWEFVSQHRKSLARSKYVVVETGLPNGLLQNMLTEAAQHRIPVCGVPTRLNEISSQEQLEQVVGRLDCLVLNDREAELMLRMTIRDSFAAIRAVQQFQKLGTKVVAITLGSAGVVAGDGQNVPAHYPAPEAMVVDTTGAGDAFVAGLIGGFAANRSFADSIAVGLSLAQRTVETFDTVKDEPSYIIRGAAWRGYSPRQKRQYA